MYSYQNCIDISAELFNHNSIFFENGAATTQATNLIYDYRYNLQL